MLENAKIIESADIDKSTVQMGAIVTIESLDENKEAAYKIVGSFETDPFNGKISNECPLAKAIIGHGINEIVSVGVAKPYEVRIKAISYEA